MIPAHREGKQRLGDGSEFQDSWSYIVRPPYQKSKARKNARYITNYLGRRDANTPSSGKPPENNRAEGLAELEVCGCCSQGGAGDFANETRQPNKKH